MAMAHSVKWLDGDKEKAANLFVTKSGFELKVFKTAFETTWDEVVDVETDGPEGLQKRITATRILALGVFALAARKKTGEAYAFITFRDGDQMALKFEKMSEPQVKAIFAPYRSLFSGPAASGATSAPADPLDRLTRLGELRDSGVLTNEEFEQQKAKILDS